MRKALFLTAVLGCLLVTTADARACGDKYLVVGAGTLYQDTMVSRYTGSILIYANGGANDSPAINDSEFLATLQSHGHTSEIVQDWNVFMDKLRSEEYDLVLAGLDDAQAIQQEIASTSSYTRLVPIVHDMDRKTVRRYRKEYRFVLSTPAKPSRLAMTIDAAISTKMRDEAKAGG